MPVFADDLGYDGLIAGLEKSISYLNRVPGDVPFQFGVDRYRGDHVLRSLRHFVDVIRQRPSQEQLNNVIAAEYRVYRSIGSDGVGHVLFTGYYEPLLQGSLSPNSVFKVPIYARPGDLTTVDLSLFSPDFRGKRIVGRHIDQKIVPYFDHEQIAYRNAIAERTPVLAWVKDPVDLFFLQIQGSGRLSIQGYGSMNVHYHSSNGRPYRSIGKLLIQEGKIPANQMSMQRIRAYLKDHPEETKRILTHNPSYVFFKTEEDGPRGYIDVTLTPGRSLALDRRMFPKAALAYIVTQKPLITGDGQIRRWVELHRFVLNQDTGGAIRGPGRADLFWGSGRYAEIAAGHMQHGGRLYLLILRPDA